MNGKSSPEATKRQALNPHRGLARFLADVDPDTDLDALPTAYQEWEQEDSDQTRLDDHKEGEEP